MISGGAKSFFAGSKCFLTKMAVEDLSNEACIVLGFNEEKQRWAVVMADPRFEGKKVLVKGDKLTFDLYASDLEDAPPLPSHLLVEDDGECGRALGCNKALGKNTMVLDESPFMVVSNKPDYRHSCWNLYWTSLQSEGPDSPLINAFDELTDGGILHEYIPDAATFFKELVMTHGGPEVWKKTSKAKVDSETKRIATVLAKWQSNGHSLRPLGCDDGKDQTAMYRFGSKLQHSCESNCTWFISQESGNLVVKTNHAIKKGEQLTIDYMGGQLDSMPVAERRQQLLERGFTCQCSRCIRESAGGAQPISEPAVLCPSGPSGEAQSDTPLVGALPCKGCGADLARAEYSKKQLQKGDSRRCKGCTEAGS